MFNCIRSIFLILLVIQKTKAVAPIWQTSQYVQADAFKVIDGDVLGTSTGNSSTPTATMPFVTSFSGIPNLGYGFTNYQGNSILMSGLDTLGNQKFQINRTALTTSSFSVLIQISGSTNIWILEVRYIAISPTFPHHLNSFDNVPINYGTTLVNLTVRSNSTQTFTNTINYTAQATAAGSTYKYFNPILTNNRILLFMTSLFVMGQWDATGTVYPQNLVLTATPINTQIYQLSALWEINSDITRLHFSVLTFDKADVEYSGKYQLVYEKIEFTDLGGRYLFPVQFLTNFMIGFIQFSSPKTSSQLHFSFNYETVNGSYGVTMPQAIPRVFGWPLSRYAFTVFYLKTWICPTGTYFDSATSTCITCSVPNCNVCLNNSFCVQCNTIQSLNSQTGQCDQQQSNLLIEKYECNSFKIKVKNQNKTTNIFILNQGISIIKKEQVNEFVDIYAQYTRDIVNETILLQLDTTKLSFAYTPSVPALYYSEKQCESQSQIKDMVLGIQIVSYVILFVSLFSFKIVGLELFGVLQLAYYTLSAHNFLNLYLSPLVGFKIFSGLNIKLTEQPTILPENYRKMNVATDFINNCNIMIFLLFAELLISIIVYLIGKLSKKQKVKQFGKRLLKQGFITMVLFNLFNISFSAGVHLKYADSSDDGYLISYFMLALCAIVTIISLFALQLTSKKHYGEFKNKFKNNCVCQSYIFVTICYRTALGFYTGVKSDYQEGTLVIQIFSFSFILFFMINLPFQKFYHNYRAGLIHITMGFSLLTTNYYTSMKSTTPMEIKGRDYTFAMIELVLIVLCLVMSFIVIVYDIYSLLREFKGRTKLNDQSMNRTTKNNETFQTFEER